MLNKYVRTGVIAVILASLFSVSVVSQAQADGITWTSRTSAADNSWHSVAYGTVGGTGLWVAVGYSGTGNRVMTSPDGTTWTSSNAAAIVTWDEVAYGNGLWVALGSATGTNQVMTSTNGTTWTSRTAIKQTWRSVVYGDGLWVAVSSNGSPNQVMTSGALLLPPAFTLSSSSEARTENTTATGFTINSTGGAIASFAINATPAGMSFNTTTGALTGTPNTVAAATNYTITATNTSGNATRTFALTVTLAAPAFALSSSSESKTVNTAITGYTITSTGGAIASYAISPSPPAGLTFNTATGLLSGTPTYVAPATAYTITGTNTASTTTQTFTLTVTAVPVVADNSAAQAEVAKKAKEQRELRELLSVIPSIAGLALNVGDLANSLLTTKCVKGKKIKYVKKGAKCPKGFVKRK